MHLLCRRSSPQCRVHRINRMGVGPSGLDRAAYREHLIGEHNASRAELLDHWAKKNFSIEWTNNSRTKPLVRDKSGDAARRLAKLRPIPIADMDLGATHRGRVLKGRLVVEPLMMTSVQSVLEDSDGDVVKVCMYNMVSKSAERAPLGERQRIAAQVAPEGSRVAIIEPFFKIFQDGNPGVRVDNPAEVVFLTDDEHLDAATAVLDVDVVVASPVTTATPDVSAQAPLQRAESVSAGNTADRDREPSAPEGQPRVWGESLAANARGKGKPRQQKESRKSKRQGKGSTSGMGFGGSQPSASSASAPRGSPSRAPRTEREMAEMLEAGSPSAGLNDVKRLNQLMGMVLQSPEARQKAKAMGLKGEAMMPDDRVAPFHKEFEREGRWPEGCDIKACRARLEEGYELAKGSPVHLLSVITDKGLRPEDVIKRLGSDQMERLAWLMDPEEDMGDVYPREPGLYNPTVLHSFTNVPNYKVPLTPGTVHVAVGFLDFGSLAAAVEDWDEQKDKNSAPLTWVGYDASPYAVAKSLVLLEMMRGGAGTDAVLQVWYSAAWTRDTLAAFKSALQRLQPAKEGDAVASAAAGASDPLPDPVRVFLRHWAAARDVPLAKARQHWLERARAPASVIGNFKVKADRLALCGYSISGQLLGGEVGSTVMCCLPSGSGELALNEDFLQTFVQQELFDKRLKGEAQDIVEAGVQLARQRISRLARLLQQDRIKPQVHLGTVGPQCPSLLASIKALRPWTISWSNVPDYMHPREFHRVARACSADQDTVHYLHSMNWVMDVKGASHIDYQLTDFGPRQEQFMEKLVKDACKTITDSYKAGGYEQLLLCPPTGNARNIVDFLLAHTHYKCWVDVAFGRPAILFPERQVVVLEAPTFNVLARANTTMLLSFTYDPQTPLIPDPAGDELWRTFGKIPRLR